MSASALGTDTIPESLRRLSVFFLDCGNVCRGRVVAGWFPLIVFGREWKGNTAGEDDNVNGRVR